LQQAFVPEPQGVQNFVVPKNVAARAAPLGANAIDQSDRLRRLRVINRAHLDAGPGSEVGQDRLGELPVERGVNHDLILHCP